MKPRPRDSRAAVLWLSIGLLVHSMFFAHAPAEAAGFFSCEQREGRWWLIDPEGKPFLSKGVCHIVFQGDAIQRTDRSPYREAVQAKFGGADQWREAAASRLLDWGFNSLGAWSDAELSETVVKGRRLANVPIVDFGEAFVSESKPGAEAWLQGIFPDVFDPAFESFCRERARRVCEPRKDDRAILGWFTDNELRWGPDWRGSDELLTLFLNLPSNAPGRTAAFQLLRERYSEFGKFNSVWQSAVASWDELQSASKIAAPFSRKAVYAQNEGEEQRANEADPRRASFVADCDAFTSRLAERYFRISAEALRAADPNHLNFGCRFAYLPPRAVREWAGRYVDVISFNCYTTDPVPIVRQYAALGRPLVIGEFTFRGEDVGLPNTRGAGPKVPNQTERAAAFERYVRAVLSEPEVVGYHWFQHSDQPAEGRFDGENSNYGVVNGRDEIYQELTRRMTEVNGLAEPWHREGGPEVFEDTFQGRLAEGWSWVREDRQAWRVTGRGLELRLQPGNMWGPSNNARNVLVRHAPDPAAGEVTVSVTISNRPTEQYEQVDLVWYYDDSHMVKLGQELVDGKLSIVMGREENDRTRTIAIIPLSFDIVEVRFRVSGREIQGEFRVPGSAQWSRAGSCDLPVHGEPKLSLQCYQGPAQVERWARLKSFRVEQKRGLGVQAREIGATGQIEFSDGAKPVLRYNYRIVEPGEVLSKVSADNAIYARPRSDYIHPLYGPGGEILTRDWSIDHPHHRGIYWAWPEVDYGTNRGDLHALQKVFARPSGDLKTTRGEDWAQVEAVNEWRWEDSDPIVREHVIIRAYAASGGARRVDLAFKFTALKEGVALARRGTDKYGGLNVRLETPRSQAISVHTDPSGSDPRRAWSDLSGVFAGEVASGLTVLQHPENPDYPGDWIQYPELSWCQPTFPASGTRYALPPGKPLVLRYRLWIHGGAKAEDDAIAREWDRYRDTQAPTFGDEAR